VGRAIGLPKHAVREALVGFCGDPITGGCWGGEANRRLIDEPVWGEVAGRSEALGLSAHRLTGSFFIERAHVSYFFDRPMGCYVEPLTAPNQDTQLHLNLTWCSFRPDAVADGGPVSDDCRLLGEGRPNPSPIVRRFLPPRERWPTRQIEGWVDTQHFPSSFLEHFARDPDRTIPPGENLVAPADGVVEMTLDRDNTSYLVIGLSFWDAHVIRAPADGVVASLEKHGIRVTRDQMTESEKVANIYESGKDAPVQKIVTLQTAFGDVRIQMITSYRASRIRVWVRKRQRIEKGERIGRVLLGRTAVLEVPGKPVVFRAPGAAGSRRQIDCIRRQ
jgi:phosphatidylserine decarboxylase